MFDKIKDWHEQRILDKSPYSAESWQQVAKQLRILDRLSDNELDQLIDLAILFLHDKSINGAQGFDVTDEIKQSIALQACLPILNLGLEWYKGWTSIIIYPSSYLHAVNEITDGERVVCVGWIESYVKSTEEREYLFDLDAGARGLLAKYGRSDEVDLIFKSYSNLLRILGN